MSIFIIRFKRCFVIEIENYFFVMNFFNISRQLHNMIYIFNNKYFILVKILKFQKIQNMYSR